MPICEDSHLKIDFKDGAIHYHCPKPEANDPSFDTPKGSPAPELKVTIMPRGSYILKGPFELLSAEGMTLYKGVRGSLCSCGYTQDQPWCDGSHLQHQAAIE
jgi:CDGSH-type Zn-finger protein